MEVGLPIELPRARMELEVGRRRHRRITGTSGLLLFVCLFLPAVRSCGSDVYPVEMPMFWHPYLYGAVLAAGTVTATMRSVHLTTIALRVLGWLSVLGGVAVIALSPALGVVELALGAVLLGMIGMRGHSERRVAGTGVVISIASLLWFGLWASSSGALVGVYLSLVASIFLLAGSLFWLSEI